MLLHFNTDFLILNLFNILKSICNVTQAVSGNEWFNVSRNVIHLQHSNGIFILILT
jgi:hypothetical protein